MVQLVDFMTVVDLRMISTAGLVEPAYFVILLPVRLFSCHFLRWLRTSNPMSVDPKISSLFNLCFSFFQYNY